MQRQIVLREVAARGTNFPAKARVSGAHFDFRAEPVEIAPEPLSPDVEPGATVSALVPEKRELPSIGPDHEVQVPVLIDVGNRESATLTFDRGSERARALEARRAILVVGGERALLVRHHEKIEIGVVIGVGELGAVPRVRNTRGEESRRDDVGPQSLAAGAPEEGVQLASFGGEEEIEASVAIEVGRIRTTGAAPRLEPEVDCALGEGAHTVVREQEGPRSVVDHDEVHVAIVVDVGEDGPEAPRGASVGTAFLRDIGEGPVSVVPIEPVGSSRSIPGSFRTSIPGGASAEA